jgi:hypothetical protein
MQFNRNQIRERRFLYHQTVEEVIPERRHRSALYEALRGKVIEVKANDFGAQHIDVATRDFTDPRRNALIIQAFVDEL